MSSENASGIPRIIHQIWIQGAAALPARYRELTATWTLRHPGWTHRLWDESSLRAVLNGTAWWRVYEKQPELTARADVARYALLQRFGGVYADVDVECRRPVDSLLGDARLCVTNYTHPRPAATRFADATNSFLASVPAHPLWDDVLARLEDEAHANCFVTERTGPAMLAGILETHADDVHLVRFPHAFTTSLVPALTMRAFSRVVAANCILDFNDSGRATARRIARRVWRRATLRPASSSA
ncbi:MAG TPA: glycosyltransferase [Thermoanaerobaculia bacterium]|nr:glycosyltransferase [Thermoanaerobaculia bacterium]